jgi:hypothetical protein
VPSAANARVSKPRSPNAIDTRITSIQDVCI